jgi:hypothetical protein
LGRGLALLESPPSDADWTVDKMAKEIYADCIDFEKREEVGVGPIIDILKSMNRCVIVQFSI